jgi:hypothetical protein
MNSVGQGSSTYLVLVEISVNQATVGFHGVEDKIPSFLSCCVVQSGGWIPKFRRTVPPAASIFYPEDGSRTVLRNVRVQPPHFTAQQSRKPLVI